MEKKTLHIIPHSHWDREWYMGFERHRMRLVELFDTLIRVMEENPDYTYYHMDGQYVVIQDYLEVRPQMKDRLLALIRADRIQVGPWYVLQDEYLTSGESNVRNMLYGIRLCRELGADPVMTGYFPDAFGNISQVPQILHGFGIDNAAFGRGVSEVGADNAIGVKRNPSEWRWRSPDGSEVVGVMFAHWYHNAMELPTDKEKLAPRLETLIRDCEASAYTPHLLGLNGCDHEPVQTDLPEAIKAANELLAGQDITVRQSNFKEYVAAVKPYAASFPQVTGELNGQGTNGMHLLINTASTHIPLKQRNHRGQNLLTQQAEPISVLAAREGDTYRDDMVKSCAVNPTYAQEEMDKDMAALNALKPEAPQENDELFITTLTILHEAVQTVIKADAEAQYNGTSDARADASKQEWAVVQDGVAQLKNATTVAQLTSLAAQVEGAVMPTATPSPEPVVTATPAPSSGYTTLQESGGKSDAAKKLQARLIELGYLNDKADGYFGAKTTEAVKKFQTAIGMTADGIATAAVQEALFASDAPAASAPAEPAASATDAPAEGGEN